jgi:hypothetical protein
MFTNFQGPNHIETGLVKNNSLCKAKFQDKLQKPARTANCLIGIRLASKLRLFWLGGRINHQDGWRNRSRPRKGGQHFVRQNDSHYICGCDFIFASGRKERFE